MTLTRSKEFHIKALGWQMLGGSMLIFGLIADQLTQESRVIIFVAAAVLIVHAVIHWIMHYYEDDDEEDGQK